MIKKKYVKRAYVEELCCDKCGRLMVENPVVLTSYPPQYEYFCEVCNTYMRTTHRYGELKFEFEEEECIKSQRLQARRAQVKML